MLNDLNEREHKLVLGEESLLRRKKELERQHLIKLEESESTIKRLQVILIFYIYDNLIE